MIECGITNANGEPCVLEQCHDPSQGWKYRLHKTSGGVTFTFMDEREKARPQRGYLMR